MSIYETLSPYEQWMVRSNLDTIDSTGTNAAEQAALLRANGYARIAQAVEEMARTEPNKKGERERGRLPVTLIMPNAEEQAVLEALRHCTQMKWDEHRQAIDSLARLGYIHVAYYQAEDGPHQIGEIMALGITTTGMAFVEGFGEPYDSKLYARPPVIGTAR